MFLAQLQRAGYPFTADDLSLDEWLDLGEYAEHREAERLEWQVKLQAGKI